MRVEVTFSKERVESSCGLKPLTEKEWAELEPILVDRLEEHFYDYGEDIIRMVVLDEDWKE